MRRRQRRPPCPRRSLLSDCRCTRSPAQTKSERAARWWRRASDRRRAARPGHHCRCQRSCIHRCELASGLERAARRAPRRRSRCRDGSGLPRASCGPWAGGCRVPAGEIQSHLVWRFPMTGRGGCFHQLSKSLGVRQGSMTGRGL